MIDAQIIRMTVLMDHQIVGAAAAVQVAAAVGNVGHELHPNPSAPRIQTYNGVHIYTHRHKREKQSGMLFNAIGHINHQ